MFIQQSPFPLQPMQAGCSPSGPAQTMYMMQTMLQLMQALVSMVSGGMPGFTQPGFGRQPSVGHPQPSSSMGSFLGHPPGGSNYPQMASNSDSGGAYAPPSSGATNSRTQNFIDRALAKQGAPYVFGAAGNGKYDCSGLVHAALNEAGVKGQRLTARGYQAKYKNSRVRREDLKPGDLVFFHSKNTRGIPTGKATHVEIYLGNGMTMGTDSPKEGAKVEPINWKTFIGGARVPELAA